MVTPSSAVVIVRHQAPAASSVGGGIAGTEARNVTVSNLYNCGDLPSTGATSAGQPRMIESA